MCSTVIQVSSQQQAVNMTVRTGLGLGAKAGAAALAKSCVSNATCSAEVASYTHAETVNDVATCRGPECAAALGPGIPVGAVGQIKKSANTGLTQLQQQSILVEASVLEKGSLTLKGRATRTEAADLGEVWVGPGCRAASDGETLVSADGLRTFRPPAPKENSPFTDTGVQVNFEKRERIGGKWSIRSNAHLDVSD